MKSILTTVAVLVTVSIIMTDYVVKADYADIWQEPADRSTEIWNEDKNGGGLKNFPGLKVRIAQGLIDMIKTNLIEYGQDYFDINHRLNVAHKDFRVHMFPFNMHCAYGNITHDPI